MTPRALPSTSTPFAVALRSTTIVPSSRFSAMVPVYFHFSSLVVIGNWNGLREADAVLDDARWIAREVREDSGGFGHREHAVSNDVGKSHSRRDALVPVDDVEVTGCTCST